MIPNEHQALEAPGPELDSTGAFALERALVMMVDDEPINIEMTQIFLQDFGYRNFCSTSNSAGALNLMRMTRPHVLLLDIQMPEMDGFAILDEMRGDPVLRHIPTIVLTSAIDSETKLRALELGASDFLGKPVDASELVLRVRNTLAARAHQEYLIHFDRLTGLPNRQRCLDEIERAIHRAGRHGGAVMQIDVDRFTKINEALGPAAGDLLLKQIALRLGNCVAAWRDRAGEAGFTEPPLLSRLDGDEFCVLLPSVRTIESVADFAARVRDVGAEPYEVEGREIYATLSVGVATFPGDGDSVDSVIRHVGSAMHKAKEAGRNTCRFYAPDLNAQALKHLSVEAELRRAIERGELCMHYQPKVDVATGLLSGAEALVRWNHPKEGLLGPGQFIPIAEASGLILQTGEWVIREVHRQVGEWLAAGLPEMVVSINVSPQQFRQPRFVSLVREILGDGALARHLCFELTETTMMDHPETKLDALKELKELGLRLSIDDFGVGYSSLSYLRRFPIDELKIDKSFVDELETSEDSAAIVLAIIAMGRSLGLKLVAEGIETTGQMEFLRVNRCDEAQGFLMSRPLPAGDFAEQWLGRGVAGPVE